MPIELELIGSRDILILRDYFSFLFSTIRLSFHCQEAKASLLLKSLMSHMDWSLHSMEAFLDPFVASYL